MYVSDLDAPFRYMIESEFKIQRKSYDQTALDEFRDFMKLLKKLIIDIIYNHYRKKRSIYYQQGDTPLLTD